MTFKTTPFFVESYVQASKLPEAVVHPPVNENVRAGVFTISITPLTGIWFANVKANVYVVAVFATYDPWVKVALVKAPAFVVVGTVVVEWTEMICDVLDEVTTWTETVVDIGVVLDWTTKLSTLKETGFGTLEGIVNVILPESLDHVIVVQVADEISISDGKVI